MLSKIYLLLLFLFMIDLSARSQAIYFPPLGSDEWETVDADSLGWCTDQLPALLEFLDDNNTKAFLVLKDGRIVIEQYFGTFTQDSIWYWASAGKSLTAFLVGQAQQEGHLDINDASSEYLGSGWTSLTQEQEGAITIRHQLTMTTGLDDQTADMDCTDPSCLQFLADPGTRWSYHNAPYTLLDDVMQAATGVGMNNFLFTRLTLSTGISGSYVNVGYNNVFFSKARSMARFGLLMQAEGSWNASQIMSDMTYFGSMISPSQSLNEAYGYLWWLNGSPDFMLPQSQIVFPGPILPNAPMDAFNALGKNGQIINVSPAQGLVVVRMGNAPADEDLLIAPLLNDQIWQHLNEVICGSTPVPDDRTAREFTLKPNPVAEVMTIVTGDIGTGRLLIMDAIGRSVREISITRSPAQIDLSDLPKGHYVASFQGKGAFVVEQFIKD